MMEYSKPQLKKFAYQQFRKKWDSGFFGNRSYGKAFYDYFELHRLADQAQLKGIESKHGDEACSLINKIFKFK